MNNSTPGRQRLDRIVAAVIGTLFLGAAGAIVLLTPLTAGVSLTAGVIGALGLEAVVSAIRGRRCLLSRIGPLP